MKKITIYQIRKNGGAISGWPEKIRVLDNACQKEGFLSFSSEKEAKEALRKILEEKQKIKNKKLQYKKIGITSRKTKMNSDNDTQATIFYDILENKYGKTKLVETGTKWGW